MIGVVHGLGAETPSQLMIFLLAANLGGIAKGFIGLAMFIGGTAGDEYGDDGVGGGAIRIQFAAAALSVRSYRTYGDL